MSLHLSVSYCTSRNYFDRSQLCYTARQWPQLRFQAVHRHTSTMWWSPSLSPTELFELLDRGVWAKQPTNVQAAELWAKQQVCWVHACHTQLYIGSFRTCLLLYFLAVLHVKIIYFNQNVNICGCICTFRLYCNSQWAHSELTEPTPISWKTLNFQISRLQSASTQRSG